MNKVDVSELASRFAKAIKTQDYELLRSVTFEVVWSLPGKNVISGNAMGSAARLRRIRLLAVYGVDIAVEHVVYGLTGFGLLLHNTGNRLGRVLDEYLTAIFQPRGTLIAALDTHISDVTMLDDYFAGPISFGRSEFGGRRCH